MAVYGRDIWDPLLIILQICALQSWFYFFWVLVHLIIIILFHTDNYPILDILFDDWYYLLEPSGFVASVELFVACSLEALVCVPIVQRSKKILDFIFTLFFIHFLICWVINGIPNNMSWWILMFISFVYTTFTAETFCIHSEMQDIQVSTIERKPVTITIPNHD